MTRPPDPTAARRMRDHRRRVRLALGRWVIEADVRVLEVLVERGLLRPAEVDDRRAVGQALSRFVDLALKNSVRS
jgi:hypothetical protein